MSGVAGGDDGTGRDAMGPFREVAARFAAEHVAAGGSAGDGERAGADPRAGLRALADAVDRWLDGEAEGDDAEAERRFVEGAGAYLASVLARALGGAHFADGTRHGLHLGDAGAFDPFAAIEETLASPEPRGALAAAVRRAEAEAAGTGDTARVVRAFVARLGEVAPARGVEVRSGHRLTLDDGAEIDLGSVVASTRGEPARAVAAAVARVVSLLPGSGAPDATRDDARARVVPRLVGPAFLERLGERAGRLLREPLAGPVEVAAVLAYEGRSRFVTLDDLGAWGASVADVSGWARANLLARSEAVRLRPDAGPLVAVRTGDALDAARLVLPELRARLVWTVAPGEDAVAVAVPHRDLLLAAPLREDAVAALRVAAAERAAAAPHAVSGDVFTASVDGVSWRPP